MVIVFVLVAVVVLAMLGALHWYVWRRLVQDTTIRGSAGRRIGSTAFAAAPLLMIAALAGHPLGIPFWLVRIIAWPGYLWLALFLYLLLTLAAAEGIRPLLHRWLTPRNTTSPTPQQTTTPQQNPAPQQTTTPQLVSAPETTTAPETVLASEATLASENVLVPEVIPVSETVLVPGAALDSLPDLSRRLFVSRVVAGGAGALAVGVVGYGAYGVLRGPRVKRLAVPLAKLPRGADGFRVAVVSDLHLGPVLGRGFAQRVVETVNATQPDLVALVGDLADGDVDDLRAAVAPLAGLRARHGVYFVTGNHEYISGAGQWVEHVRELGLRLLANARVELPGFDLAGVNDLQGRGEGEGPDLAAALADRDPARAVVLMAHQPVIVHDAVRHGVDLQFSGHTHGGQLWPGNLVAGLANPTLAGLERYGDTQLYVTRGAGAWGPPVRVGAPSDITLVELVSPQA